MSVRAQLAFAAAALFLVLAAASAAADAPALAVSDAMVTEGDSGAKNALFTVSLSAASAGAVTVDYVTADGSATAPGDYAAARGTLTFAPGELSKQVVVAVVGETLDEPHETYSLNLSNPAGATLGDPEGKGRSSTTILRSLSPSTTFPHRKTGRAPYSRSRCPARAGRSSPSPTRPATARPRPRTTTRLATERSSFSPARPQRRSPSPL